MKTLMALASTAAVLAAVGCTTTNPTARKYTADAPPPLVENTDGRTKLPPTRISDTRKPITQDDINEDNYVDQLRKLENNMRSEGRSLTQAGK